MIGSRRVMISVFRFILLALTMAGLCAPAAASYDARGNTTNNGKYSFVYDFANQPVTQTGTGAATFAYDGNLKRVKEVRFLARVFYGEPLRTSPENAWAGKTIYTVYSRVTGGLAYRDEATDGIVTDYVSVGAAAVRSVIPGRSNRRHPIDYDKDRYRDRHLIENAFCRLKDFRRIATRYDKLSRNFHSAAALATLVAFWL